MGTRSTRLTLFHALLDTPRTAPTECNRVHDDSSRNVRRPRNASLHGHRPRRQLPGQLPAAGARPQTSCMFRTADQRKETA